MGKKLNHWKRVGSVLLMAAFVIFISILFLQKDIEEEKIQNADIETQMQALECGKSFTVTESSHSTVIKRIEKTLKNSKTDKDSLLIGNTSYRAMGASYNWDGKFVWEVQKNDSSYFEILIENQDLGLNIAKAMTVSLICK